MSSLSPPGADRSERADSLPLERPPAHVLEQLRAQLAQEPAQTSHAAARGRKWVVLPLAALALLVIDVAVRHNSLLRADIGSVSDMCVPSAAGALMLAFATTFIATSRGKSGLGQRVPLLRWSALAIGPLSIVPMSLLVNLGPQPRQLEQRLDPWGLPCFAISTAIATISLLVLIRELRRSVPVAPGWRSAALGSAAGSWAGLALLLHCPSAEAQHLAVGHLLPICLFPLLGLLFAQRQLRI